MCVDIGKGGVMRSPARSVLLVVSWLFVASWVTGAPPRKQIESLIAQLASPNKPPGKIDDAADELPSDFDRPAQERVFKAWKQLYDRGIEAFPYLLKNVGDKRYCFTMDVGSTDFNLSVGSACLDIVRSYLEPFGSFAKGEGGPLTRAVRPQYVNHFKLSDRKSAEQWWNARKTKTMRDLQIEVLDWVIGKERENGKKYSKEEITYIEDVLTKLRKSNEPLKPLWPFSR